MALSIKGRKLSDEEENQILEAISENSDLVIICLVSEDEETDRQFVRALAQVDEDSLGGEGQFYKGTLKNGQVLETEASIVVLGDVYPGSAIISARDIICSRRPLRGSLCRRKRKRWPLCSSA